MEAQHFRDLEADIGHVIDPVLACRGHPTQGHGLVRRGAAEKIIANVRGEGHVVGEAQEKTGRELNGPGHVAVPFTGMGTGFGIGQEIGLEPLVHAPDGEAGVGVFHVQADPGDPDALQGLGQSLGRMAGDPVADLGHFHQFPLAHRIRLCLGLSPGLGSQGRPVGLQSGQGVGHGLQALLFLVTECPLRQPGFDPCPDT